MLFPKDRVRVEFLAVASRYSDISEPAATYLAEEADPGAARAPAGHAEGRAAAAEDPLGPRAPGRPARARARRAARARAATGPRGSGPRHRHVDGRAAHTAPPPRTWPRSRARWRRPSGAPPPSGPRRPVRSGHRWPARGSGCCGRALGWASRSWQRALAPSSRAGEAGAPADVRQEAARALGHLGTAGGRKPSSPLPRIAPPRPRRSAPRSRIRTPGCARPPRPRWPDWLRSAPSGRWR